MTDKIKGAANNLAGNTKQAIGKATDNPELEVKGIAQEAKGDAQNVTGSVKGALGDRI